MLGALSKKIADPAQDKNEILQQSQDIAFLRDAQKIQATTQQLNTDANFTYEIIDPIPYNAASLQELKSPIPITKIEGEENKGEKETEEQNRVETEES